MGMWHLRTCSLQNLSTIKVQLEYATVSLFSSCFSDTYNLEGAGIYDYEDVGDYDHYTVLTKVSVMSYY